MPFIIGFFHVDTYLEPTTILGTLTLIVSFVTIRKQIKKRSIYFDPYKERLIEMESK